MTRLLIVTERFWPETFIINDLASELANGDIEVTVFTQQPSYPSGRIPRGRKNSWFLRESWNNVKILRFKTITGYRESIVLKVLNYFWFAVAGSFFLLFHFPVCDKIFIYQTGPLSMAVPGIIAARLMKKPLTIWTQDVWPDSVYAYGFREKGLFSFLLRQFVKMVYRNCDNILISCEGFKKILEKYTDRQLVYMPNWPLNAYLPGKKGENKNSVFLFAGNIGKVQNLENILKGFSIASRMEGFSGELRIVGDGSFLETLKNMASDLDVPVCFPGKKNRKEMNREYDKTDFLILSLANQPVFRLTVPSKFQMYLSVAKPILCAAGGEVSEMVKNNNLGIASDPDNLEDIAQAFYRLGESSIEERKKWKDNSRMLLKNRFDRVQTINAIKETIITTTNT